MPALRIAVLQHEPFEGPGLVEDWAKENNQLITIAEVYKGESFPQVESLDWLVIMGGGMSVNDEHRFSWLKPEKAFVKKCMDAGKVVIGFCLGSQMIANVLGKKVYRNSDKEIGWYPITLTSFGSNADFFNANWNGHTFFHWHGETYDLPAGATHLAQSDACKIQAFSVGDKVFAFQFHPETNRQTLKQMVESGGEELVKNKFVMTADEIMQQQNLLDSTKPLFYEFLSWVSEYSAVELSK